MSKSVFLVCSLFFAMLFFSCEAVVDPAEADTGNQVLTLHANYEAKDSTVTQRFNANVLFRVKNNPFTRPGYKFLGWTNAEKSSIVLYNNRSELELQGDTDLYALWRLETYTISYVLNGGKRVADYSETYTILDSVTLDSAYNGKYRFDGWHEKEDFSDDAIKKIPVGSFGNKVLYAQWSGKVTYHVNEGVFEDEPAEEIDTVDSLEETLPAETDAEVTAETDETLSLRVSASFAAGKTFSEVMFGTSASSETSDGTAEDTDDALAEEELPEGCVEKWYTIHTAVSLPVPVREDYEFAGWFFDDTFETPAETEYEDFSLVDVHLYAKWEQVAYTVTYHYDDEADGKTLVIQNVMPHTDITLANIADVVSPSEYICVGWSDTSPDAADDEQDAVVDDAEKEADDNAVLLAGDTYTVTDSVHFYPVFEPVELPDETSPEATEE